MFNTDLRELTRAGEIRSAPPQVLALLELLIANYERMVSKDEIVEAVWNGRIVSDGSINSRVKLLRQALDDDGKQQRLIKTVHGQGFRFVGTVEASEADPDMASDPSAILPLPDRPSIAVLPFDNMSSDPDHEFLADGICEDILTALSKVSELFVIARNSTFVYKGRSVDVRQVGRELGVAYVLEGSVRSSGPRLRITAQLIDARSGEHVWAERYDRQQDEIFALQDEITLQIVSELLGELITTTEQARIWVGGTGNFDAWQAVVRGTMLVASMERAKLSEAVVQLERAISIDPEYASAHVVLANAHFQLLINGWTDDPMASLGIIAENAQQALAINPSDPLATAMISFVALCQGDLARAEQLAQRAVELGPNIIASLILVAMISVHLGAMDRATQLTTQCLRLSPIGRRTISTTAAFVQTSAGNYEAALHHADELLNDNPNDINGLITAIICYEVEGDIEKRDGFAKRLLAIDPQFSIDHYLASKFLQNHEVGQHSRSLLLAAGLPG